LQIKPVNFWGELQVVFLIADEALKIDIRRPVRLGKRYYCLFEIEIVDESFLVTMPFQSLPEYRLRKHLSGATCRCDQIIRHNFSRLTSTYCEILHKAIVYL
jgi:hypothetical protein